MAKRLRAPRDAFRRGRSIIERRHRRPGFRTMRGVLCESACGSSYPVFSSPPRLDGSTVLPREHGMHTNPTRHVVTGAFGYSGKHIARRLLDAGHHVATLTNSPNRPHEFGDRIEVLPLAFEDHDQLVASLRGADVLYNTYWVRFNHRMFTHDEAVRNTKRLFAAARDAGVRRIVHTSITKPSLDSPFEYFRGKAELEDALRETGVSHAILRPRPCCSAAPTSSSTISPGRCAHSPSSACSATAGTACSPCTWTTSQSWPSSRGPARRTPPWTPSASNSSPTENSFKPSAPSSASVGRWSACPPRWGWPWQGCSAGSSATSMLTREEIGALMAGSARHGCGTHRPDEAHRVGDESQRHARQALRQRTGPAQGSNRGVRIAVNPASGGRRPRTNNLGAFTRRFGLLQLPHNRPIGRTHARTGGGAAERAGLENRFTLRGDVGSNPTLSASRLSRTNAPLIAGRFQLDKPGTN